MKAACFYDVVLSRTKDVTCTFIDPMIHAAVRIHTFLCRAPCSWMPVFFQALHGYEICELTPLSHPAA